MLQRLQQRSRLRLRRSRRFARRSGNGRRGRLRLGVLGGGCTGLSYQFKFDTKPRANDKVFDFDGVQIFIDPKSILYLHA